MKVREAGQGDGALQAQAVAVPLKLAELPQEQVQHLARQRGRCKAKGQQRGWSARATHKVHTHDGPSASRTPVSAVSWQATSWAVWHVVFLTSSGLVICLW